jgi:type II secretory pathway component PulF
VRELLDKLRDAVLPPKNRFLEILGFSLESGMDLRSSVAAARTHVETLADHHRVNMLEAAIERGEGLIEALLEADLVGIDELSDLRLAEESGFLAMTLTKMGQKAPKSALLKSVDVSGKTMVGVYLVFLAGGIGWVFISML